MKVKGCNPVQQAEFVQIFIDRKRRDLFCASYNRGPKSELIHDRHSECLHHRTRVLSETLLAGDQRIPMMCVLHLPLLQIFCKSHVVMGANQKTSSFPFQPTREPPQFRRMMPPA